jgi:outer membrane autotransporter protein
MCVGLCAKALGVAVATLALLPSAAVAQVQIDQNFNPLGPSPKFGPLDTAASGDLDNGKMGTVNGAIQAILLDPALGPDTMFIGSPNGGIWGTTDGGINWTALTKFEPSLSIASLALDVTDNTGNTLIAGIGITSSGSWGDGVEGSGGNRAGLLYSTDGGQNWTSLGAGTPLEGQSVIGVASRQSQSTILAATFEERDPTIDETGGNKYGLYISTDGGTIFNRVLAGPSGLPEGPVTSLVADPDPSALGTFYAAVTSNTDKTSAGVYVTTDYGTTWSPVFTQSTAVENGPNVITGTTDQLVLRVAAGPNGSLAIAAIDAGETKEQPLIGLYLLQQTGGSWSAIANPLEENGATTEGNASGVPHLALAIDPSDSSIVYLAGSDIADEPHTVPVYRIQGDVATSLSCQFNSKATCVTPQGTVHADARALVVDANGDLFLVGDGGVYLRTNPQSANGAWRGFNAGTLQVSETYAVAYGAYAKRAAVASQDTGVGIQSAPSSILYNSVHNADGHVATVRDVDDSSFASQPVSVYYTSSQTFDDLTRLVLDGQGKTVSPGSMPGGVNVLCRNPLMGADFTECGTATGVAPNSTDDNVTFVVNANDPSRIALSSGFDVYVTQDNAPASAKQVKLTLTDLDTPLSLSTEPVRRALAYGASDTPDVLLAGRDGKLYVATTFTAGSLTPIPEYENSGAKLPVSIVFGESSANFYVVDGTSLWSGTVSPAITITDLTSALPANITRPHALAFIDHNGVDALLVGGLSGASTTEMPQSPIAWASSVGGTLGPFNLFGAGIPNVLVFQMAYNPIVDVLAAGTVGGGVWTLYDVTSYFPEAEKLQFGLADNDSRPSAIYLTNGTLVDRPLEKYGTGTLTIGNASYTGDTTIFGGTLAINGTITSKVIVNPAGTLTGIGTIDSLLVAGGMVAPGPSFAPLTVNHNAVFGPGAYQVDVAPDGNSDQVIVGGTVDLTGAVLRVLAHNGDYAPLVQYVVIDKTSPGGITGTFAQVTSNSLFLKPTVAYDGGADGNDVVLTLAAVPFSSAADTRNQKAVSTALDQGAFGPLAESIFFQTKEGAQQAFNALSGEVYATTAAVLANDSRYLRDSLVGRMMQSGYSGPGTQATALGTDNTVAVDDQAMGLGPRGNAYDAQPQHDGPNLAFWTRAFGAWANLDGNANVASASRQLGGFVSGMDAGIGTGWRIGAATGLSQSSISVDARHSAADVDTTYLAAYAGGSLGPVVLRTGGAWGWSDIDTSRAVIFPGLYEREQSSYGGNTEQLFGEAAYPILIGCAAVEPFGGVAFVHVSTDSFHERGDVAALRGTSEDDDVSYSTLGLRVAATWHVSDLLVVPHASAVWQHAYGDLTPDAALAFASTGAGFVITGVPLAPDSALIDIGLDLNLDSNISLGVSYAGQFASEVQDNAVKGRFTWLF